MRKRFPWVVLALTVFAAPLPAQPENDLIEGALPLALSTPTGGSTITATGEDLTSCANNDIADVWFSFTPATSSDYTFSLCGSNFDTTLTVFDAAGSTELACHDDACGSKNLQSELTVALNAGEDYLIRISGYDGGVGDYILTATTFTGPANSTCETAIELQVNTLYLGDSTDGGSQLPFACAANQSDSVDVWHDFTPTQTGDYTISLCGSAFDTTLTIYDDCEGFPLVCNDDDPTFECGLQSRIDTTLQAQTTYYIRVSGYNGASGAYQILITGDACEPPAAPSHPYPASDAMVSGKTPFLGWFGFEPNDLPVPPPAPEFTTELIYGTDDRLDEFELLNPALKAIGDSTVVMLFSNELLDNGDGTFSLDPTSFADDYMNRIGRPLCVDEPYLDQPAAGECSGFLVAPDVVATAGHCVPSEGTCANVAFILGYTMNAPSQANLVIDESQVYSCDGIIANQQGSSDWALVRLDRPVPDHLPIPVRFDGKVGDNEDLVLIGHPQGLPRKYADNATVRNNGPFDFFEANLDAYGGNSGAVVLNTHTLTAEGILVRGNTDFIADGDCDRSNICPDEGCPSWEDVTRTTAFADRIPRFDVYLGTHPDELEPVCQNVTSFFCEPNELPCGQTYYWRVVRKEVCEDVAGPLWSFSTYNPDLLGDVNVDCTINLVDFVELDKFWLKHCSAKNLICTDADLNQDRMIDILDLHLMIAFWLIDPNL